MSSSKLNVIIETSLRFQYKWKWNIYNLYTFLYYYIYRDDSLVPDNLLQWRRRLFCVGHTDASYIVVHYLGFSKWFWSINLFLILQVSWRIYKSTY